ncbi:MAG: hypothetical protein JZU64_05960 [Rhodoferax sp.]|nr:hypothetical protein [Rhodoferax sp.]
MSHEKMTMKMFRHLLILMLFGILSACGGGGGGSAGLPSGTFLPITTTAPAELTVAVGSSQGFAITGGRTPYQISSTNVLIATGSVDASNFWINGVASGIATLKISDAAQQTASIVVTVPELPTPAALSSNAPSSLEILNGSTNFYKIFGGFPPYAVTTSNGVIVRAVVSGSSLAITGVVPGNQTVAISDAAGALITIDVKVNSGLFTDAPSSLTLVSGTAATYTIYGGTPYSGSALYRVNSSSPFVASASVSGATLSITGLAVGQTTLVITDSVGDRTQLFVTVPAAGAILSTAPSDVTLIIGTPGTSYDLYGGDGIYTATSSNPAIVTATVAGSKLTIGAVANTVGGTAQVIVTDAKGSPKLTINVTASAVPLFTTAPSSLAIAAGAPKTFAVIGGSLPYSVVNTNPGVVRGDISGNTLVIAGYEPGSGTIIINDAKNNQAVTIAVVVIATKDLFSDAPGGLITLVIGNPASYTVTGGTPIKNGGSANYSVNSTNPAVLKAQFVGSVLTVTGLTSGTSTVRVTDAVGATLDIDFTVGTGTGPGPGPDPDTPALPTLVLSFVDDAGVEITNHVLSQSQLQKLKIVVRDASGAVAPFTRVQVALDSGLAVLVPTNGTQLTDQSGVVFMRITPSSVSSSGTVRATVTTTVDAVALTSTYDLQINPGTVTFSPVTVSPASVQKGQSVNVSVDVSVNGVAARSNSVAVTFSTACGTVAPSSALVDAAGKAVAVIQTTSSGSCAVDASVNGVTSNPASYTVTSAPTTNIQFVDATPALLYQSGSAGPTTSIVKFKVIDSLAVGVPGIPVSATLTNTDGGISFCGSPSTGTTSGVAGSEGTVTFSICAGTLPATVQVRASFVSNGVTVSTSSNVLTIQTGLPTQRFFDISANVFNFYAGGYFTSGFNGNSVTISVFAADRQGNPVPDGTKIVFVTEGGQINSAGQSNCLIANGRCSVTLIGQDYRPMGSAATNGEVRPGRVTVLAYTDGEESFVDANFNNRYDAGELFEDLGTLYLDKDESGLFAASYKNLVTNTDEGEFAYPMPAGSFGTAACPNNSNIGLSYQSTCNGNWDGLTKVRRSIVIIFSGGEIGQPGKCLVTPTNPSGDYDTSIPAAKRTQILAESTSSVEVLLADCDGNPLPATAALSVDVISPDANTKCAATLLGTVIGSRA